MSSVAIGLCVLSSLLTGFVVGFLIRRILPEHHLTAESKDAIKFGTGMIATMAALVLGLLVGSAKGAYDTQRAELTQLSAKLILLDRALKHYGDDAKPVREQLKKAAERLTLILWRDPDVDETNTAGNEALYDAIFSLTPKNDAQRTIQSQSVSMAVEIAQIRWLLHQQSTSSVAMVFVVALVVWLTIIFTSIGLFSPINSSVIVTMILCVASVAGAIFLILELDRPFSGTIQIPKAVLQNTVELLGR